MIVRSGCPWPHSTASVSKDRNSNFEDYTWGVLRELLVHFMFVSVSVKYMHAKQNSGALPDGGRVSKVSWSLTLVKTKSLSFWST